MVSQPDCMTSPPESHIQKPASASRAPEIRSAPICNGTRYVAIAIAIGVTNRKIIVDPCIVNSSL